MFYVINFSQFCCLVDHVFPILARGLFQKLLEKALTLFYFLESQYQKALIKLQLYWQVCFSIFLQETTSVFFIHSKAQIFWQAWANNVDQDHTAPVSLSKLLVDCHKVSMIRKYNNHKLQNNPRHLEEESHSALDKLLGQLGIYATWLSSIAYLQKQLHIFYIFTPVFGSDYLRFLIEWAIANMPTYLLSWSAFLSIKLVDFHCTWSKSHRLVDISCSHPFC